MVASFIRSRRVGLSLRLPSTPLTLLILRSSSVYRFLTSLAAKFALEELLTFVSTRNDIENLFWDKFKGVRSVEDFGTCRLLLCTGTGNDCCSGRGSGGGVDIGSSCHEFGTLVVVVEGMLSDCTMLFTSNRVSLISATLAVSSSSF